MLKRCSFLFLSFFFIFSCLNADTDWQQPKISNDPSDLGHIFRNKKGHFSDDTPENRAFIEVATENPENRVATNNHGLDIYLKTLPDGTQAWAEVRKSNITNGGKNNYPKIWVSDSSNDGGHFETPKFTKYALSDATFQGHLTVNKLRENFSYFNKTPDLGRAIHESKVLGVASRCGVILDLFDHFDGDENLLLIPNQKDLLLSTDEIRQIMRDVARGVYVHHTLPFFSLHTNSESIRYPVIPPCYRNTYVGYILSLLDYYMKGLSVGFTFDEAFLFDWVNQCETREAYLSQHVVSYKELFQDEVDLDYQSFNEILEEKCGGPLSNQVMLNGFDISYRIVAYQDKIYQKENVLSFDGDFDVVGIVNWEPQNVEEKLILAHLEEACDQMCEVIRKGLPRIPLCKKLLQGLQLANFFSYYYNTLKESGKIPLFDRQFHFDSDKKCLDAFPPIPLGDAYEITIDLYELFKRSFKKYSDDIFWFFKTQKPEKWVVDMAVEALYNTLKGYFEEKGLQVLPEQVGGLTVQLLDLCRTRYLSHRADMVRLFHQFGVSGVPEAPGTVKAALEKMNACLKQADSQEAEEIKRYKELTVLWYQAPFYLCFNDSGVMFNRVNGSLKLLTHLSEGKVQMSGGCGSLVEDLLTEFLPLKRYTSFLTFKGEQPLSTVEGLYFRLPFERIEEESFDEMAYTAAHLLYYPKQGYPLDDFILKTLQAISLEDWVTFHQIPADKVNWGFRDAHGLSFLHYAAQAKNPAFLERLLKQGMSASTKDDYGLTPMHHAARAGREKNVEILYRFNKALLEVQAQDRETPLFSAVQSEKVSSAKRLLCLGANPNHRLVNDMTPLVFALQSDLEDMALVILEDQRVDALGIWKMGITPLELAIQHRLPKVLKRLIELGANVNRKYQGATPLHLATELNWAEGVAILLGTRKVQRSVANHLGESALEMAQRMGYLEIEALISNR